MRSRDHEHGDDTDDAHGQRGSVAIRPDGEVPSLGVDVLWSAVTHCTVSVWSEGLVEVG